MFSLSSNRREFVIRAGAGIACGLAGGGTLMANSCGTRMTLGFSLYGMKDIATETAIKQLKGIGYDSIEFCLADGFDTHPDQLDRARRRRLRESLDANGMCLRALMENLPITKDAERNKQTRDKLKKAAQLAHDLNDASPPLIETILGSGDWLADRSRFAELLRGWAAVAERENVTIVIKPHRNHMVDTPDKALWLIRQIASQRIQLGYDYSHYVHRGIDMDQSIRDLADHIGFVHVKDAVVDGDRVRFALPGSTSDIDYKRLLERLVELRYTGDVCVEVSSQIWRQTGYDSMEAARSSYDRMARAFHQAGIHRV